MAAIRSGQTDMAEFLIDVGINYNFKTNYFVSISKVKLIMSEIYIIKYPWYTI